MNTHINKQLLFQYFSGNTTVLENARIELWLAEESNQELFYDYLDEWERSNLQFISSKEVVFNKFHALLAENDSGQHNKKSRYTLKNWARWWAVAGCIMTLMVMVYLCKDWVIYKTYATNFGETMTLVLDDESQVVLNANSELKVPRWLDRLDTRAVWLEGEAFFKIQKKENRSKFLVHTQDLTVEVLGTRFNVTARHQATKVVLQEGQVKVKSKVVEGEQALLTETGDFAEVKNIHGTIQTRKVDETLFTTWQEKRLKFENARLDSVLQVIQDFYGVHITVNDTAIESKMFSGTLPNNELDAIMLALTNIYNTEFTVQKKN